MDELRKEKDRRCFEPETIGPTALASLSPGQLSSYSYWQSVAGRGRRPPYWSLAASVSAGYQQRLPATSIRRQNAGDRTAKCDILTTETLLGLFHHPLGRSEKRWISAVSPHIHPPIARHASPRGCRRPASHSVTGDYPQVRTRSFAALRMTHPRQTVILSAAKDLRPPRVVSSTYRQSPDSVSKAEEL